MNNVEATREALGCCKLVWEVSTGEKTLGVLNK